jgi:ABC-type sugar transport system substrate-binding protein
MERGSNWRSRRLGGSVAAAAAAGSVFAAVVWGGSPASAKQYQYDKKVTICHHTGSQTNPFVNIAVSRNALPAHLAHGDTLGLCP